MQAIPRFLTLSILGFLLATLLPLPSPAADSSTARKLFAKPPREFATAPLWVWNDLLTEQQIRETMRDLAGQQVKQVFVHPRPGLMTPYLGPDWFRLWNVALDEAGKLDMNVWIYDENSYPSGFAGGFVPELMPESRGMGLAIKEAKAPPAWSDTLVAVHRAGAALPEDVTAKVRAGEALPEGRYVVSSLLRAGNSPWHGNRSYVNLLTLGVTEKFLDVTLGAYEREIGKHFGRRVPGVFTDEPNIRPAGGFPWCADLPEQFQKRWGYSLLTHLPSLIQPVGDWRKVRHNYFSTINDLFIERWAKPFYERCDRLGLEFTGHYWDHEWPHCTGVPDNMAMAAWQHRPGIDTLMNQYAENTHAQFGNVRFCREISSVANQLGRKRTLVELYGAGGWDLRLEDMKRIGDWLQVLGINTMDEHLSYVTLRGARKRDHPQSFSYHEPWWEAYHCSATYLTRISAALTQGQQVNRILVLEPTTTAWMYQGDEPKLRALGDAFFNFLMTLEAAQIEYDLGCENVIAREGRVEGRALRVGQRLYERVVIPPGTENLDASTWSLLRQLIAVSQQNLLACEAPIRESGTLVADGNASTAWKSQLLLYRPDELLNNLRTEGPVTPITIDRAAGDKGILFHHRRELADGQILFLVNTSIDAPSSGSLASTLKGVEIWDPNTGTTKPYPFRRDERSLTADFSLPPSGSLLLFFSKKSARETPLMLEQTLTIPAASPTDIRRIHPNVLTLDYVDVTARGESRSNAYFYAANQFVWQRNGMERNPWDSAVQFQDELITKTFPADSGFAATYRFTIEGPVPADLAIVIERPDLYTITCNGQPLTATPGDWWLDKAFGKLPLARCARSGVNTVTLTAQPFTIYHELEPAYVLGEFALKPTEKGFVIVPPIPLRLGASDGHVAHGNNPDGTMWLSGGVGYEAGVTDRSPWVEFDLGQPVALSQLQVWNYNEGHVRDLTGRGTASFNLTAGATAAELAETLASPTPMTLGTFSPRKGNARAASPDVFQLNPGRPVRFLRLAILRNFQGVSFPCGDDAPDNGFVGLAKVRFLDAQGKEVTGVSLRARSSELASHQRRAAHLLGQQGFTRGAGAGWNEQGLPFYAHGVAYRQSYSISNPQGSYFASLPDWYGSAARVTVNGKPGGYITAPPWDCDITPLLKRGDNTVEIVVLGTLKNTLGPHHGGHALGSAWPGMFQNGPMDGPPPGANYSSVGYGLFAPFELRQVIRRKP